MALRAAILQALEQSRGRAVSGQELANGLGVSRAAVWKAVRALREEGYAIRATQNLGYALEGAGDAISEAGLRLYLPQDYAGDVRVLSSVGSTNTEAKKWALDGARAQSLLVADGQFSGRGRRGRAFFSPQGKGVYMSAILRPERPLREGLPVTFAAALAVARAIERLTGEEPRVKWVNDVFVGGKKVCGILTEAIGDLESGGVEAVVVGVGLNVRALPEDFPAALRGCAASVRAGETPRSRFIAEIARGLFFLSEALGDASLHAEYCARSNVLGRRVCFGPDGARRRGRAVDIDARGRLCVEIAEGLVALESGEIALEEDGL